MKLTIQNNRIHIIDSLRGFALLGLPFVNVIGLWMGKLQLSGATHDVMVQRLLYIFVEGRFYAIFSFLFGAGIWIFLSRVKRKQTNPYALYYRRMIILLIIGFMHQLFQPGEALFIYAVLGMILPLFYKLPKQINFFLGIVGIILGSILSAKLLLPLPFMILGIAFADAQIFERVNVYRRNWRNVAIISGLGTIGISLYFWVLAPALGMTSYVEGVELSELQMYNNEAFYLFAKQALSFAPIFIVFYLSLVVLLATKMPRLFTPLNAFGRMAFTNYLGQTFFLLIVSSYMAGSGMVSYTYAVTTCAVIVIIQILFSMLWMKYFQYGPLEWLWRCGTYGRLLPIRREIPVA